MKLHLIATMHALDAHNQSADWSCDCIACQSVKQTPQLAEAIWRSVRKSPPKPQAAKTPPVLFMPNA